MACEKYSGWMTDAALGGLHRGAEAELRAHIAACGNCRSEWEAARALAAAVDRGVEAMVAGAPSPLFTARLRARLAEAPAPVAWPFLTWPRIAAAALIASTVLVTVLVTRTPERTGTSARIAANAPSAGEQPSSREANEAPGRAAAELPAVSRHDRARARNRSSSLSFEVLVPKGQLSAALDLSEGVRAGRIDGAQLARMDESSAEPLEVKALEIRPLADPSAGEDEAPVSRDGDGHE